MKEEEFKLRSRALQKTRGITYTAALEQWGLLLGFESYADCRKHGYAKWGWGAKRRANRLRDELEAKRREKYRLNKRANGRAA